MPILRASPSDIRILHGNPGPISRWAGDFSVLANAGMFVSATGKPVGALVSDNKAIERYPTNWPLFRIRHDGKAEINRAGEWKEYWDLDTSMHAVSCGPLLVWNGRATEIDMEMSRCKLDSNALRPKQRDGRTGIGVTDDGDVLLAVLAHETLFGLQQALLDAGAVAAINLDGGGSSVLYRNGRRIVGTDVRRYPSAIAFTRLKSDPIGGVSKMVPIVIDFLPTDSPVRPGERISPLYITVHSTANTGATARDHAAYLRGPEAVIRQVSWHYTVDDIESIQHLPEDEMGWHAGDRDGNRLSIGIEICEFDDADRQQRAIDNTAWLVAQILSRWPSNAIVPHKKWMPSKSCPRILLERPGGWQKFTDAIKAYRKGWVTVPTIRQGDSGTFVRTAQQQLKDAGHDPGPIDGFFGGQTDLAVRTFQAARGLAVDGVIGDQTWEALRQEPEQEEIDWQARALRAEADNERLRSGIKALIEA